MTKRAVVAIFATLSFVFCSLASFASAQTYSSRDLSLTMNADAQVLKSIEEVKVELVDKVRDGCWPQPNSTKDEVEQRLQDAGFKFSDEAVVRVLVKGIGYRHNKTCIVSLGLHVRYVHTVPMPSSKMSGPLKAFDRRLGTVSIAESEMVLSGSDLQNTITDAFAALTISFELDLMKARR